MLIRACLDNVPDPRREAAAVEPAVLGDADDVGQVRLDHDAAAELADERGAAVGVEEDGVARGELERGRHQEPAARQGAPRRSVLKYSRYLKPIYPSIPQYVQMGGCLKESLNCIFLTHCNFNL